MWKRFLSLTVQPCTRDCVLWSREWALFLKMDVHDMDICAFCLRGCDGTWLQTCLQDLSLYVMYVIIIRETKHCISLSPLFPLSDSLLLCRLLLPSSTLTLWWGAHTRGRLSCGTTGATRGPRCRGLPCLQQHIRYRKQLSEIRVTLHSIYIQQKIKILPPSLCSTQFTVWMWSAPRTPTTWLASPLMERCAPGVWTCFHSHR